MLNQLSDQKAFIVSMKSFLFCIYLSLWHSVVLLKHSVAAASVGPSYYTFVSGGHWINMSPIKRRNAQLLVKTDVARNVHFKTVNRLMVAADFDSTELLDVDMEEPNTYIWTSELASRKSSLLYFDSIYQSNNIYFEHSNAMQDAKLLSELKRLKKLRWYKVAKLMGEGATARNCHDRWRELVWPENLSTYKVPPSSITRINDGWEDDEVGFSYIISPIFFYLAWFPLL